MMIPQHIAEIIFKIFWLFLLSVALAAQYFFAGKIKRKGSIAANAAVIAPYLIVFGWFSVRAVFGAYRPLFLLQTAGIMLMVSGVIGYCISILFLRSNWAVSAAIKEQHTLTTAGPYRYVRHPMYFFMILEALGSGLLISNFMIIAYVPLIGLIYYYRALKEEALLRSAFGGYQAYAQKTKILIPFIM